MAARSQLASRPTSPCSSFARAERKHAGTVWVNTYHALDPAVPFGGYKMSGYGKEGGTEHLEEYLTTKTVWINLE